MKRFLLLGLMLFVQVFLVSCDMTDIQDAVNMQYCEEYPNDQGCLTDGIPTYTTTDDDLDPDNNEDPNGNTTTTYIVTFDVGEEEDPFTEEVNEGDMVDEPEIPIKDGYVFFGWFEEEDFITRYDFDTVVSEDITLYALFQIVEAYDGDEPITLYCNNSSDLLEAEMLRIMGVSELNCSNESTDIEAIGDIFDTTGNLLSYALFSQLGGAGTITINDVQASEETIRNDQYAYETHMEYINRSLWVYGDEWHIGENDPYAAAFAWGLEDFIWTSEGADVVESNGGITYHYDRSWNDIKTEYDYECGDTFLDFETKPNFRIGVAPGVETIARALVAAFLEVCPNFLPNIEITDTHDIFRRVQGDLSAGNTATYLHFGFADRAFNDQEPTAGLTTGTITKDAIVFLVNSDNPLSNLEPWQIWGIFDGTYITWDDVPE